MDMVSRRRLGLAVSLVLGTALFSGCAGESANPATRNTLPRPITDPNDYSYLENGTSDGSHIHDYWNGKSEIVIFDDRIEFQSTIGQESPRWIPFYPPSGNMVIPGTRWVNATVFVEPSHSAVAPDRTAFHIRAANGADAEVEIASGIAVSINSTERMNDLPHQKSTLWGFWIKIYNDSPSPAQIVDVTFDVEIQAVRGPGPLPVAPAHPDHWANRSTIRAFHQQGPLETLLGTGSAQPTPSPNVTVIPPGADRVDVRFEYNSSTDPMLHYEPRLGWRGADRNLGLEASDVPPTEARYQQQNGYVLWEIEVESRMWDSFYANESQWIIGIDWTETDLVVAQTPIEPVWMDGDYTLIVEASRSDA